MSFKGNQHNTQFFQDLLRNDETPKETWGLDLQNMVHMSWFRRNPKVERMGKGLVCGEHIQYVVCCAIGRGDTLELSNKNRARVLCHVLQKTGALAICFEEKCIQHNHRKGHMSQGTVSFPHTLDSVVFNQRTTSTNNSGPTILSNKQQGFTICSNQQPTGASLVVLVPCPFHGICLGNPKLMVLDWCEVEPTWHLYMGTKTKTSSLHQFEFEPIGVLLIE